MLPLLRSNGRRQSSKRQFFAKPLIFCVFGLWFRGKQMLQITWRYIFSQCKYNSDFVTSCMMKFPFPLGLVSGAGQETPKSKVASTPPKCKESINNQCSSIDECIFELIQSECLRCHRLPFFLELFGEKIVFVKLVLCRIFMAYKNPVYHIF